MIFESIDGSKNLRNFNIPFFKISVIFAVLTVLGTQITRFGISPSKIILPWEFPILVISFFLLSGLCLGLYVLKNPKNFLLNILSFFLFASSVGALGWTVLDEFSLIFVSVALLFVIKKGSFDENYSLKDYGINLVDQENETIIDTLNWKGLAKKDGMIAEDIITEFKIENLDRPNKAIIYPFALVILFVFGYLNYRRKNI